MTSDVAGVNRFSPSAIEAHLGDTLRFTLRTGVHNVHFHADKNPPGAALPRAGPILQFPGQTYDVEVTWQKGTYVFMCHPHASSGMEGSVEVR